MPWFAVRTFIRSKPTGRAKERDDAFRPGIASIEERIVLFQARTGKSALTKGRAEAERYAREQTTNTYGQRVIKTVLPFAETYELFDDPANGTEVFSSIEIIDSSETTSRILRRKVGDASDIKTAKMFISGRITKELEERLGRW